tara:strand:+ start:1123 stop:1758 length:636 start_codon:yes stop_codon:yes gene_type:complete
MTTAPLALLDWTANQMDDHAAGIMRVLVLCEQSGTVRDAFIAAGHDAVSCDINPTRSPGPHIQRDALELLAEMKAGDWDLIVAFPPCTHLAASGARWWPAKRADGRQAAAVRFVEAIAAAPCPRIAIENPVGYLSSAWRKPDQYVQPWMFGHGYTKRTGLWLKGIPLLEATDTVPGRADTIHKTPGGAKQAYRRSITPAGLAAAMADQWSR